MLVDTDHRLMERRQAANRDMGLPAEFVPLPDPIQSAAGAKRPRKPRENRDALRVQAWNAGFDAAKDQYEGSSTAAFAMGALSAAVTIGALLGAWIALH